MENFSLTGDEAPYRPASQTSYYVAMHALFKKIVLKNLDQIRLDFTQFNTNSFDICIEMFLIFKTYTNCYNKYDANAWGLS